MEGVKKGSVRIDGVSFNIELCSRMTLQEFKKIHGRVFYKDKTPLDRESALDKAYNIIKNNAGDMTI